MACIWSRKSSKVKVPSSSRWAAARPRPARRPPPPSRSGWRGRPRRGSARRVGRGGTGRSPRSSRRCDANAMGRPTTSLTDSAAPPRASPSSLVRMTPSSSRVVVEGLGDDHRVLAGHGVDDEERVVGLELGGDADGPGPSSRRRSARRPAVSKISTSRPSRRASATALRATSTGSPAPVATMSSSAENTGTSIWAASVRSCCDRGGPLEVGADQHRVAALRLEPTGELRRVGRLARALEAGHEHDGRRLRGVGDPQRLAAEGRRSVPRGRSS